MVVKCETSGVSHWNIIIDGTSLIMTDTQWLEQSAIICILRIIVSIQIYIYICCPFPCMCGCVCVLEDELRRNNESWENILVIINVLKE